MFAKGLFLYLSLIFTEILFYLTVTREVRREQTLPPLLCTWRDCGFPGPCGRASLG